MNKTIIYTESQLIGDDATLTLVELCQACSSSEDMVRELVAEGVLEPAGRLPQEWRFGGASLRRLRVARQLALDLEVNTPGIALALDLLDRIEALQAEMARMRRY